MLGLPYNLDPGSAQPPAASGAASGELPTAENMTNRWYQRETTLTHLLDALHCRTCILAIKSKWLFFLLPFGDTAVW